MDFSIGRERIDQEKQEKKVELQAPRIYLFPKIEKNGDNNKKVENKP